MWGILLSSLVARGCAPSGKVELEPEAGLLAGVR